MPNTQMSDKLFTNPREFIAVIYTVYTQYEMRSIEAGMQMGWLQSNRKCCASEVSDVVSIAHDSTGYWATLGEAF